MYKAKQIAEYIETGKTDKDAMENIERRYKISKHKRGQVPFYEIERKTLLK